MANLNKVMLIGRLTRDPEVRTFSNGGKVAKIGFAVNNRKRNQSTGQWEEVPVFLDVEAFNRQEGRQQLADLVEQYLKKGHQAYIEGHLVLDEWTAQDGQKRNKLKIVVDNVQFLQPRSEGGDHEGRYSRGPMSSRAPVSGGYEESGPEPGGDMASGPGPDAEIPF
jgi:single-strand DNA-binding protein